MPNNGSFNYMHLFRFIHVPLTPIIVPIFQMKKADNKKNFKEIQKKKTKKEIKNKKNKKKNKRS